MNLTKYKDILIFVFAFIVIFAIGFTLFTLNDIQNKYGGDSNDKRNGDTSIYVKDEMTKISNEELEFQDLLTAINSYKIEPTDSLEIEFEMKQLEDYKLGHNTIEIFKEDSLNVNWLKINSNTIDIDKLKTINPRIDGEYDDMFCQSLDKIKLYNDVGVIFLQFVYHPCNGLGCSVFDFLIYNIENEQINLFGNFRTANLDLYNFPINDNINYIATEYRGSVQGNTQVDFIGRIYSMDRLGNFQLDKDKKGNEYYVKVTSFPNDTVDNFQYTRNWF